MAADGDIVRAQLLHYFHPADAVASLPAGDAPALIEWLVSTGRDRWAAILTPGTTGSAGRSAVSDGYGLRVLDRDDGLFFLPLPGGPNFGEGHRVLEIVDPPSSGELRSALAAGTLALTERGTPVDVALERADFVVPALTLEEGVLRVDDFVSNALDAAIIRDGPTIARARIIDLRFNGGGRVDSAVRLLQSLLGERLTFGAVERRDGIERLGAEGSSVSTPLPESIGKPSSSGGADDMTVLVSRHTASAAEWVARVLQLHGAQLVGERSEGKCLVHDSFPAGDRQLVEFAVGRLSVDKALNGYDYCDFGLVPDIRMDGRALIETSAISLALDAVRVRICFARADPGRVVAWQKELDLYLPPGRALRLGVASDGELCLVDRYGVDEADAVRADIATHTRFVVRDVVSDVSDGANHGR